jgi:hypothetical protein
LIKRLLTYFSLLVVLNIFGQSTIGLKIGTISFHPIHWDQNFDIFENKLTKDASITVEPGYQLTFQKFVYLTIFSIEIRQGIHADAAGLMAGHIAGDFRWKFFHKGRSAFSISLGPVYAFRQHWDAYNKYEDHGIYNNKTDFQDKWLLGSELEYDILVGNRHDITVSLMYNNAYNSLTFALGYRFWISPYVNLKDDKCSSCGKRWTQGRFRKWWRKVWH